LQPEKLSERATRIAQEAKALQETIEKFGSGFENRWRNALRKLAVEEVEQVSQKVLDKVEEKYLEIRTRLWPFTKPSVSVCAEPSPLSNGTYNFSAKVEEEGSALRITNRRKGEIHLTVDNFNDLIADLKASILKGKLDEQIHLTAEQLIYSKFAGKM